MPDLRKDDQLPNEFYQTGIMVIKRTIPDLLLGHLNIRHTREEFLILLIWDGEMEHCLLTIMVKS